MIVVDTNVIAYLVLPGEFTKLADRLHRKDPEWIAPKLWLDEFLNILSTYERVGKLEASEAMEVLKNTLELMEDASYEVPPERILKTARETGCSAYDSQYIVLAQDLGVKLYTCDKQVIRRCPDVAVMP